MEIITFQDGEIPRTLSVGFPDQDEQPRRRKWSERFPPLSEARLDRREGTLWDPRFPPLSEERQRQILARLTPRKPAQKAKAKAKPITPHTYLVGAEGSPLVKIGYTGVAPLKRLASLQTGQPMTLSLLWSLPVNIEGQLHKRFAAYRVRGEWFDLTPLGDAVEVVQAAADKISSTS